MPELPHSHPVWGGPIPLLLPDKSCLQARKFKLNLARNIDSPLHLVVRLKNCRPEPARGAPYDRIQAELVKGGDE